MLIFADIDVDSLLEIEHSESLSPDNIYSFPLAIFLFEKNKVYKLKIVVLKTDIG